MNFGNCNTPDCDYRTEQDSDYCLLCDYVLGLHREALELEQKALRYEANVWRFVLGRLYPDEREAA